MTKEDRKSDYKLWFIIGLALIIICFFLLNWGYTTHQENKELKGAVMQYEALLQELYGKQATMTEGANKLFRELKECRNDN